MAVSRFLRLHSSRVDQLWSKLYGLKPQYGGMVIIKSMLSTARSETNLNASPIRILVYGRGLAVTSLERKGSRSEVSGLRSLVLVSKAEVFVRGLGEYVRALVRDDVPSRLYGVILSRLGHYGKSPWTSRRRRPPANGRPGAAAGSAGLHRAAGPIHRRTPRVPAAGAWSNPRRAESTPPPDRGSRMRGPQTPTP